MTKYLASVTIIIAAFSLFWVSAAFPASTDPFNNPQPVYEYDWTYGLGSSSQAGITGPWYSTGLNAHVGQSAADGGGYTGQNSCYWTSVSGTLNGFSLSNGIGDWIDAIGSGGASIRFTIREDYTSFGLVDNADVIELTTGEVETIVLSGAGGPTSVGMAGSDDMTALEWGDFDEENMVHDHLNSINNDTYYRAFVNVAQNQDDETVYMTFGAKAQIAEEALTGTTRTNKSWTGTHNGYSAGATNYYITGNPVGSDESVEDVTFDGTNWFLPVTVSATTYNQRMDLPYDEVNYPASSGAVLQWYDDYDLYLAGADISNPGAYGVGGRYLLERDEFLVVSAGSGRVHHADILYETRTYDPIGNADGPESPYEWLYDASGDMWVPTNGSGSGGDTELERAFKLIGFHPGYPDDDTQFEMEWSYPDNHELYIWENLETTYGSGRPGALTTGLFVDSWRLAGLMLGQEFWDDDPDYAWSPEIGAIAERTWGDELLDISWIDDTPIWTWDSVASEWELPTTYDGSVMTNHHIWDWINTYTDTPVAGYDEINNFMRYVFDIDAVVVEDADDDGEFDVGDDYVLFSVVDDGLYTRYQKWGTTNDNEDTDSFFGGEYFDGDTIFLYDGTSVTTYFDAATGVFFGSAIVTVTGFGTGQTIWSMYDMYDLDGIDIDFVSGGIIPEPATIILIVGAGLALGAGILRKKMR